MAEAHPIPSRTTFKNCVGQRFGRLVVTDYAGHKHHHAHWICRCDCGSDVTVSGASLLRGATQSCGCLNSERVVARNQAAATHRLISSGTYRSWRSMIQRCTNRRSKDFPRWGGRGIRVCARWRSFVNFLADMGLRPAGTELDRINNEGSYEPGNCRWATEHQQQANRRDSRKLTYNGRTQCLSDWAIETGLKKSTLWRRLSRLGWSLDRALTTPARGSQ